MSADPRVSSSDTDGDWQGGGETTVRGLPAPCLADRLAEIRRSQLEAAVFGCLGAVPPLVDAPDHPHGAGDRDTAATHNRQTLL
jgi:hypothetical protein